MSQRRNTITNVDTKNLLLISREGTVEDPNGERNFTKVVASAGLYGLTLMSVQQRPDRKREQETTQYLTPEQALALRDLINAQPWAGPVASSWNTPA